MAELRFTLIGEGSSGEALVLILEWLLEQHLPDVTIEGQYPDFGQLLDPPRSAAARIVRGLDLNPCMLLFVHRDADRAGRSARVREIKHAADTARRHLMTVPPVVPVIPVRMLEAWLLADETAIRHAVGNQHRSTPLNLPRVRDTERLADPKHILREAFLKASGLRGHLMDHVRASPVLVARATASFTALRLLPAFRALETDVQHVIREQGWPGALPDQP